MIVRKNVCVPPGIDLVQLVVVENLVHWQHKRHLHTPIVLYHTWACERRVVLFMYHTSARLTVTVKRM